MEDFDASDFEDDGPGLISPAEDAALSMLAPAVAAARATLMAYDRSLRRFDDDGHLHVEVCNISKANVCPYYGREIPNGVDLGLEMDRVYYLYRDSAELEAAVPTYENKPLMMQHVAVSAEAPQKFLVVGTVSGVHYVHPYLKASLAVWDQKAIDLIDSGEQEQLSCGYRYVADMSPGTTPEGEKYDGVMRGLKCNHVALVEVGRAGPDVLVSDELPQDIPSMKISAIVKALGPVLATDAKPADVQALIVATLAADKAKDADPANVASSKEIEKKDQAKDEKEDDKEAKAEDAKGDPDDATDEDPDMDADDEFPEAPESGAKKPGGKDKAMDKKGMDAAIKAGVAAGLAADRALQAARKDVEPIVGVTAFDSAGATYGAALKKLGIDHAGVHASAYGAILRQALSGGTKAAPSVALDSAGAKTLRDAIPSYNRLSR